MNGRSLEIVASIHNPIPPDLIRDLIALARLVYAVELARGGHPVRLQEIGEVGRSLKEALEFATRSRPGTLGMQQAWLRADAATEALGRLIAEDRALPLVHAVEARMLKIKRSLKGR
jgi:hypothetical protein